MALRCRFLGLYEFTDLSSKEQVAYQVNLDRDHFASRALGFLSTGTSVCWIQISASFFSLRIMRLLLMSIRSCGNLRQNFCQRTHASSYCCTVAWRCSHHGARLSRQALYRGLCRACSSSVAPAPWSLDLRWITWPMTSYERRKATHRWPLVSRWTRPIQLFPQSPVSLLWKWERSMTGTRHIVK